MRAKRHETTEELDQLIKALATYIAQHGPVDLVAITQRLKTEATKVALRRAQGNRTETGEMLGVSRAMTYLYLPKESHDE